MTALPRHLKPALETMLSSRGRYDARKVAEYMGLSLRDVARLLQRDVSVLSRNGDTERLQAGLRPIVIVLDLISSTDAPPHAIRTWLRSPIPGLGYRVPLEMIREGQTEELIDTLTRVVEGTPG